ncbi:transposase family protein [Nocardia sp. R16R-3T]
MVVGSALESLFGLLLPHLSGVRVDGVDASGRTIRLDAHGEAESAACPDCGTVSERVHSRYMRQLTDLSIGGRAVCIRLHARRFRCLTSDCQRKIFAEQIASLAGRYQRRSSMLTGLLTKVALALGGRAGQRMTGHLATEVPRSTLLRLIRALPLPAAGALPAVGIDDFAIRKGNTYGTVRKPGVQWK